MPRKSTHQLRVESFMLRAGQAVPVKPFMPDEKIRELRARLILEEAFETVAGLGCCLVEKNTGHVIGRQEDNDWDITTDPTIEPDMVEIIDGCADIKVVTTGTLSACGVADEGLQQLIDASNLAKFGPGGHKREDGKWIKPDTWRPPALQKHLDYLAMTKY